MEEMANSTRKIHESEIKVTLDDFLRLYNEGIPSRFPQASAALLKKYKNEHEVFFKHGDLWSLDQHRKKVMDWLPHNTNN